MPNARPVKLRFCTILVASLAATMWLATAAVADTAKSAVDLWRVTNIWNVHLRFTPDQWEAMEPAQGAGGPMFGGPPGRAGGPGGANRSGPGGPPPFGPGMFLAPGFMAQADANTDGKISRDEFSALAEKWFTSWDKKHLGKLNEGDLREGLNTSLAPTGGGPGQPGGGPGPGIMLQGREGKRNGLASAAGIEFKYVHADLEVDGQKLRDVAVRYKGNGTFMESRDSLKRSLKVSLSEYVKGQKLGPFSKINFHNCVTDASYMNEVLSHRLYRDAGVPAPKTAYARVYVTVPGKHEHEYFGLYSVVQDVDSQFAAEFFGTKKGAIFKPVTPAPFTDLGDDWKKYNQTYDPKTELSDADKKRVIEFCKLVSHASDEEFAAKFPDYVDLENFSRFMAVTTWLSTLDSILAVGQNYYVYLHPKTGKLHFIPWDLDHSFGQFPMIGSQEIREQLSISKPWQGQNRFLERVYKTEAFQKLYRTRLTEFSDGIFKPERFALQVDQLAGAIRPAVEAESQSKLKRFEKVVAGEPVPPRFFGENAGGPGERRPGGPGGPDRFVGGGPLPFMQPSKPIKPFANARTESIKKQLNHQAEGQTLNPGFGPMGGGPGGERRGGFGPGMFLAAPFMRELDADKNGEVSKAEFAKGFQAWYQSWDVEKTGSLTQDQLRDGLNQTFRPPAGFGGPRDPARREPPGDQR